MGLKNAIARDSFVALNAPNRPKAFVMGKILSIVFLFSSVAAVCQPLRDINYEYIYDPDAFVSMQLEPVKRESSFTILYDLQVKDTLGFADNYVIQWEGRSLLSDKEGIAIELENAQVERTSKGLRGTGTIPADDNVKFLVAKVIYNTARRAWIFYTPLEPNYPVSNHLIANNAPVVQSFVHTDDTVHLAYDSDSWIASYYDQSFPAAAPAFSEAQARVPAVMRVDSVFRIRPDQKTTFPLKGLYLLQRDTTAIAGLAFRAEEDYPQYSKLTNLPGPLVYITTRQEYDKLEATNGNKKAFDRVILGIAADTDRARTLMRNYFRRVELANRFFTSYKEGWKTDRGMIYIIFGRPDQVFRFEDREVWNYDNERFKLRFNFSRSSSLFDPDNYVLIRDKKYEATWYEVIDLWRNARF